jgi:hydrogenase maturation protease
MTGSSGRLPLTADHQLTVADQRPATIVIGYGSELRGDDALGRVVARHLAQYFAGQPAITVLDVHQLTLDLAEIVKDYERILLIDARAGERPGELFEKQIVPGSVLPDPFSHYVSPPELLAITEGLYGARPEMRLLGITASSFALGTALSPAVAEALPALVARVKALAGYSEKQNPAS